jgi:HAE1 family hydrophobic/amphiphilic exporter-1
MKLAEICVRHPVFATMLTACLLVLGILSFQQLGVDLYPKVDFPTITITTFMPGAGPEELESTVTKVIEEAVNTISGIDELSSTTIEGVSRVTVTFVLERSVEESAQDVRDKVAAIVAQLPPEIDPPIIEKMDPDAAPVMSLTVSSGRRDLREITEIADKQIKQRLESINGIGQVIITGGRRREIHVFLDGQKLRSYGVTVDQVRAALQRENVEMPGGKVEQGKSELTLRILGRIDVARDFSELIVARVQGSLVRISDLGSVEDGYELPVKTLARLDGKDAVTLQVRKQSGTNTIEIITLVKKNLEKIRAVLPPDLNLQIIRDQSIFINASVHAMEEHLVLGGFLASLVVLLFMRNLRSTLIAAVAVPTSIISTFFLMRVMDLTLNNWTLLGLMLAVGIVIDDAIVVLENIFRYVEEEGYPPFEAAISATKEIGLAVMATTLSLVVIFVPIGFMTGTSGRFVRSFAFTMAFSIVVSLFISFTLTPMLSSRFLKPMAEAVAGQDRRHRHTSKDAGFYSWIEKTYVRMLEWSMANRLVILSLGFLVSLAIYPAYQKIGKEYMARDDTDEFLITLKTPEGTSLEGTNEVLRQLEAELTKLRGVQHLLTSINSSGRGTVTDAEIYVRLVELDQRTFRWFNPAEVYEYLKEKNPAQRWFSQFDIMADARRVLKRFPNVRSSVAMIQGFRSGGRGSGEVEFSLRGPDLEELGRNALKLQERMRQMPGLIDVDSSWNPAYPEMRVIVDREKAADLGVRIGDVASALRTMVSGEERVTRFKDVDDQYEVRLRVLQQDRNSADRIAQLMIPSSRLGQTSLENFAKIERGLGPAQIDRYNRQRQITVVCNLDASKAMEEAVRDINGLIRDIGLPAGYDYGVAGRARRLEETIHNFGMAFALSLIFMYMILGSQFDSFIHPITIMSAIPLSIPFALGCLIATDRTLNMRSALGILLLFGIVKKNGILQVDFMNVLRSRGADRAEAIVEGNRARLRPILMTTISIVAGLIPAALSKGPGSASNNAIAISVIGGQTCCLLITLLLTPVLYSYFDDFEQAVKRADFAEWVSGAVWKRALSRVTSLLSMFR